MIMKSLVLALVISTAPLAADCFGWEIGGRMGYRWDNLEHALFNGINTSQKSFEEDFNNLSTAQIAGFTKLRLWWLEAGVDADYGWTVGGHIKTTPYIDTVTAGFATPTFKSCASGEVWDAFFTGGIRVPFWDRCDRGFFITPLGGYSFSGIREKRRNVRPNFIDIGSTGNPPSNPTFVSLPDTSTLKRDYKGPFAGVSMSILNCQFFTSFGYAYHFVDLDQRLGITQQTEFYNSFGITTFQLKNKVKFKPDRNRGNRGWLSLNYQDPCGWRIGVHGTYFSVSTRKKRTKTTSVFSLTIEPETDQETTFSNEPSKARWQTFTTMLEAAYEF